MLYCIKNLYDLASVGRDLSLYHVVWYMTCVHQITAKIRKRSIFVVSQCLQLLTQNWNYKYSFVVSVDNVSCSNESQFEKWWQDRKQNPVGVTYPIHHSILSTQNKVSQAVFIFCKMWHTKSPPDCLSCMQSLPITTEVVSLNPVYGEVYSIQHYVIKFVSDLRQGRWFSPGFLHQ